MRGYDVLHANTFQQTRKEKEHASALVSFIKESNYFEA